MRLPEAKQPQAHEAPSTYSIGRKQNSAVNSAAAVLVMVTTTLQMQLQMEENVRVTALRKGRCLRLNQEQRHRKKGFLWVKASKVTSFASATKKNTAMGALTMEAVGLCSCCC
jgi:hypothetical protein